MTTASHNQSRLTALRPKLVEHEQEHVLRFAEKLSEAELTHLLDSLETIAFDKLDLFKTLLTHKSALPPSAEPHDFLELEKSEFPYALHHDAENAGKLGRELIAQGKVAALVVAGGEGTRLGFNRPKGFFPIYPLSQRCLFDAFAAQLRVLEQKHSQTIPWYIQTSDATHQATRAGFEEEAFFGLDPADVTFFKQASVPALDADGRLLLTDSHRVIQSPDGHGGCIDALRVSGALEDMKKRGVEWIYYFQVDNAMERVCDPNLIGITAKQDAEIGVKVVRKLDPDEKVGVLGRRDAHPCVVEYSELSEEQAKLTDAQGHLSFCAGNTAIHVFRRSFLERVAQRTDSLPWHAAHKKVAHIGNDGAIVTPDTPNAYKFERFIFDTFPLANKLVALEVPRRRDFVPLKNASGPRSASGVQATMQAEWKAWLSDQGLHIPESTELEIAPELWAQPEKLLEAAHNALREASPQQILLA